MCILDGETWQHQSLLTHKKYLSTCILYSTISSYWVLCDRIDLDPWTKISVMCDYLTTACSSIAYVEDMPHTPEPAAGEVLQS